jgi:serine/threonine-protein kinase
MPLSPGQILNQRYRIVKLLGQGGFGAVYRAWDMQMEGVCAVKENLDTSPSAQRQFEREAKLLYKLRHPNLPRVFDHFVIEGQGQYLVMDYIEGKDLEAMLASADGHLPVNLVLDWIGQVSSALTYLHSQEPPIIHRDIKPANIRIMPDGQAILVDFGIAKASESGTQTTTGARALTPGYAPIEQYGLGKTDARSDIYALGATLYAALTGERPIESVQRTVKDGLIPPEKVNPAVSIPLSRVIRQALEIDPEKRFQSASQFKRALETAVEPQAVLISPTLKYQSVNAPSIAASASSAPLETQSPTRQMRWGVLGGVIIFALISGAILVTGLLGMFLFNKFTKPQNTQTAVGLVSSAIVDNQSPAETKASLSGNLTASPQSSNASLTPEIIATSSLFSPALKPEDIPIMPGAEEVQAFQMNQQEGKPILSVLFRTSAADAEIIAFYEREMPANGWTKTNTYMDANQQILYFSKGDRIATVSITQTVDPRMVGIMVMQQ